MKKRSIITSVAVLLLLFITAALGWWWHQRYEIETVKRLTQSAFAERESMSREERSAAYAQVRDARDGLNESQQKQLGRDMRNMMMQRMQEQMDEYFEKPPNERTAFLDERIRRDEERRRERDQSRREREARGESRTGGERGGRNGDAGGGRPGGPPGGRRGRGNMDNDQRMEWRRRMLDATSPQFRAQMAEYREDMRARRESLGLDGSGGRGRGRFF